MALQLRDRGLQAVPLASEDTDDEVAALKKKLWRLTESLHARAGLRLLLLGCAGRAGSQ